MGERIILHCDLNSFYASVELLDKPALWEVPVAVCGDPKTRHGIILAKNEPAKKYGIQTAETVWQAKRSAPASCFCRPITTCTKCGPSASMTSTSASPT